jgi:hypothetical protein
VKAAAFWIRGVDSQSALHQNALALERRFIGVDNLIKFTRGEVTAEYGLRDDVRRFGIADEAQG